MAGYHLADIPRGKYGELSKIFEEVAELKDALDQGCQIMVLHELSDIIGAIEGYMATLYDGTLNLDDLIKMAHITHRAFESGHRK